MTSGDSDEWPGKWIRGECAIATSRRRTYCVKVARTAGIRSTVLQVPVLQVPVQRYCRYMYSQCVECNLHVNTCTFMTSRANACRSDVTSRGQTCRSAVKSRVHASRSAVTSRGHATRSAVTSRESLSCDVIDAETHDQANRNYTLTKTNLYFYIFVSVSARKHRKVSRQRKRCCHFRLEISTLLTLHQAAAHQTTR